MRMPVGRRTSTPRPGRRAVPDLAALALVGVASGAAGTAAMSTGAWVRREVHARRRGIDVAEIDEILDYDDSDHVVIAASTLLRGVLGWAPRSPQGKRALFWTVHAGYGSAVGMGHAALHRALGREPAAGAWFFVGCQTMCFSLFPLLGDTPVPWRWSRPVLVTSLAQHVLYAGVAAGAGAVLRRHVGARGRRRP